MSFPEPQKKPEKKLNYKDRVKAGLQRGGLKPFSKKGLERFNAEQSQHQKNIQDGIVFCVNCGGTKHIEKHHYCGRNFPNRFIYLCGEFGCGKHKWIHENENKAMEGGWLWPQYRGLPENKDQKTPWL